MKDEKQFQQGGFFSDPGKPLISNDYIVPKAVADKIRQGAPSRELVNGTANLTIEVLGAEKPDEERVKRLISEQVSKKADSDEPAR